MGIWFALILMCAFVGLGGVVGAFVGRLLMEVVVKAIAIIPRLGAFILRVFRYFAGGAVGAWAAFLVAGKAASEPDGAFPLLGQPAVWIGMVVVAIGSLWATLRFKRHYE